MGNQHVFETEFHRIANFKLFTEFHYNPVDDLHLRQISVCDCADRSLDAEIEQLNNLNQVRKIADFSIFK